MFSPDDKRLFYSVREPIANRVFSSSRQRGFASKSVTLFRLPANCTRVGKDSDFDCFCLLSSRVCVRSRCWDACMVVDGGTSFEFNDGAIATISMSEEDQLRTVVLDNWHKTRAWDTRPGRYFYTWQKGVSVTIIYWMCAFYQMNYFQIRFFCRFLPPTYHPQVFLIFIYWGWFHWQVASLDTQSQEQLWLNNLLKEVGGGT